jgi:hypothetical protein
MELRVQIFAMVATSALLLVVLELVRRRRLLERYALVWLFSAGVLLGLAAWTGLLNTVASAIGIKYAPSALFVIAFGFILILLLHFSIAVSRLSDRTKVLAQRLALVESRLAETEATLAEGQHGPDEVRSERDGGEFEERRLRPALLEGVSEPRR